MSVGRHAAAAEARCSTHSSASGRDIVVVGGSAGAFDPLRALVAGLPADYRGTVLIVSHIGANPSQLPELLRHVGPLPATHAQTGNVLRPGHVYVAPPDCHMLIADGHIELSHGPREHFTRPAIDPLFRSAARAYGPRVVGIVLSGTGSDGAAGLEQIKRAGGAAMVQDPAEALAREMPETAAVTAEPDYVLRSAEMAALLVRLATEPLAAERRAEKPETAMDREPTTEPIEHPVAFSCPECGGALREMADTRLLTYRCHIGHRFSATELLDHQHGEVEQAVAVALRVLNERTGLCRRMIADARAAGRSHGVAYWSRLVKESEQQLEVLQRFLTRPREAPEGAGGQIALKAGK